MNGRAGLRLGLSSRLLDFDFLSANHAAIAELNNAFTSPVFASHAPHPVVNCKLRRRPPSHRVIQPEAFLDKESAKSLDQSGES
jgi:hypothetical protein